MSMGNVRMNVGAIPTSVKEKINYVEDEDNAHTVLLAYKDEKKINKKHGTLIPKQTIIYVGGKSFLDHDERQMVMFLLVMLLKVLFMVKETSLFKQRMVVIN